MLREFRLSPLLWLFFLLFVLFQVFQWTQFPFIDTHALRRILRVVDGSHNLCPHWGDACIYVMPEHTLYIFLMYLLNRLLSVFGLLHPLLVNHLVFGVFFAFFVVVVILLSRQAELEGRKRWLAVLFMVFGAPGLVLMLVQTEDDVAYFGFLLLFWWLMARQGTSPSLWRWADNRTPWLQGLLAGSLLGVAMTINPIVLIYLSMGIFLPWLWWTKRYDQLVKIVVAGCTSIVVFYLIYLPLYPNLLAYQDPFFTNLQKALSLWRGHAEKYQNIPFFSSQYLSRSFIGFSNMVLQPRHPYGGLGTVLLKVVPWLWLSTFVLLLVRGFSHWRNSSLKQRSRISMMSLFFLVALGQAFVFETGVNERWSMAFLGFCMLLWWVWKLETQRWLHLFFTSFVVLQLSMGLSNLSYQAVGDVNVDYQAKLRHLRKVLEPVANRGKVEVAILPVELLNLDLYTRAMLSKALHGVIYARARRKTSSGQIPWAFHRRQSRKEPFPNYRMIEYYHEWHKPDAIKDELSLQTLHSLLKGKRVFVHPRLQKQWKQWLAPQKYYGGK